MADFFTINFDDLEQDFSAQLAQANTAGAIELVRVKFLGRKSPLASAMKQLADLPQEQRADVGRKANELKVLFETQLVEKLQAVQATGSQGARLLDVTLPGSAVPHGRLHPVTQTMDA